MLPPLVPGVIARPAHTVYSNVTSRTAVKAYLQTILAGIIAALLLGFACAAYILFYLSYIPQISLSTPVHLIYGQETVHFPHLPLLTPSYKSAKAVPYGTADIPRDILTHEQHYDVYVSLTLPTSPHNFDAGSFMINLTLFNGDLSQPAMVATARRPARLTYKSQIVQTLDTVMRAPLYLSGWRREQETLEVLLMEGQEFGKGRVPEFLSIRVGNDYASDKAPEAYESHVLFRARFRGLRYFMYNYRIVAFVTFTSAFWMTELFWASVTWLAISSYFFATSKDDSKADENSDDDEKTEERPQLPTTGAGGRDQVHPLAPAEDDSEEMPRPRGVYATPEPTPAPDSEEGDDEDEDSEALSNGRSDEGGQTPTSMDENAMQGSAQDSGVGTSLSENWSEGLVRRRSGRWNG
ncbi:Seipin [Drechslerella dactyloides]|uniref:Seipin n=1 Tax=Drechslerella dactyloides TaxID=74499 RepID=A0AAD6IZY8_DREDA|nr:Seipin [Drechslerella dactyloides]